MDQIPKTKKLKPLKVRVVIDVMVDRNAYEDEYNEPATADQIRAHIKSGVYSAAESDFRNIDAITVVDFK